MRKLLSVIVSLMTAMTFAQQPVELPLWPDGAPNSNGLTGGEKEVSPHRLSNVTAPTITVYRAPQPNGMAVIMCPGAATAALRWIMKDMTWHLGSADKASLTLY